MTSQRVAVQNVALRSFFFATEMPIAVAEGREAGRIASAMRSAVMTQ